LHTPLKIQRETEKAYGVNNPAWEEVQELLNWGGGLEVMRRGSPAAKEAYQNKQSLSWLPKSHSMAHEGHIVTMSPWLAKKQGISTHEAQAAAEQRFEAGKQRYNDLLSQAKQAGVPGVRERMKMSTIKEKMRAHGMSVDDNPFDDYDDE
jgi:hypothetical protein